MQWFASWHDFDYYWPIYDYQACKIGRKITQAEIIEAVFPGIVLYGAG